MSIEWLEALVEDYAVIQHAVDSLNLKRSALETKLDRYFRAGVAHQECVTNLGTVVRTEHEDITLLADSVPMVAAELRDQFDRYFTVGIFRVQPTAECLALAADRNHPLHALLIDRLEVRRERKYYHLPVNSSCEAGRPA